MSSDQDKDQIINELKAERDKTRADFESYKNEFKQLEELLETDVKKKQDEIRKTKEESLKKERTIGQQKAKIAEMQKDIDAKTKTIAQMNDQLSKFTSNTEGDKVSKLQQQIKALQKKLQQQTEDITKRNEQIVDLNKQITELKAELEKKDAEAKEKLQQVELEKNEAIMREGVQKDENSQLTERISALERQLQTASANVSAISAKKERPDKKDHPGSAVQSSPHDKSELKQLRLDNDRLVNQVEGLQRELARAKEAVKSVAKQTRVEKEKSEEVDPEEYRKLEKSFRDLKAKYSEVTQQKKSMTKTFRQLQKKHFQQLSNLKQQSNLHPAEPQQLKRRDKQNNFYVLIRTKKHYISPFLEWNGKTLKMLKQTKTAFSKSLGCLKYNADWIGFDGSEVVNSIVEGLDVEHYKEKMMPSTVILFGNKKTSKKAMFLEILKRLQEKLLGMREGDPDFRIRIRAYKAKINEPAIFNQEIEQSQELSLSGAFEQLIQLFTAKQPEDSPGTKKIKLQKTKPKPKQQIRFVSIQFNQQYKIQLLTSSNTSGLGFKQHDTLQNSLQHLFFSHLPPQFLCSLVSTRFIVLPINPIVQQYDSCKLSLSLINQQYNVPKFEKTFEEQEPLLQSPVKEDNMINDSVRKKIENLERENEQAVIKIGRLEQDCGYYRARIGDFVVRIKNIVSSQNKQNSYLKKSPMTLTLEKLEQSMASILRKTTEMGRTSNFQKDRPEQSYQDEVDEYEGEQEEQHAEESVDVL